MDRSHKAEGIWLVLASIIGTGAAVLAVLAIAALLIQRGALKEESVGTMTILAAITGGIVSALFGKRFKGIARCLPAGLSVMLLILINSFINLREGSRGIPAMAAVCIFLPSFATLIPARRSFSARRRKAPHRR